MKFKTKKLAILLLIGLILPIYINNYFNFSNGQNKVLIDLKDSKGYNAFYIHIDGSDPGNWSATASTYDWCSGDGSWDNPYIIENVTIDASSSPTGNGIFIENSKNEYFIIRNCTVYNSGSGSYDAGIRLDSSCNGTIINNNCSNNGRNGITLRLNCKNNTISGNTVNSNPQNGIYLYDECDYNNITGNTGSGNNYGIHLFDNCHYNNITGNLLNNNRNHGIRLEYSDYNRIIENTANSNEEHGIYIYWSEWNNISNNYVNFNKLIGIYLRYFCMYNVIDNNMINENDLGIMLQISYYNNLSENTLSDNNYCICEHSSSGNVLSNNVCSPPKVQLPISIDGDATGVGAHNWTWAESQIWCSGSGTWNDPYIIENLIISGFGAFTYGIEVKDSDVFFIIRSCKIYNAIENGIYLDWVNNSQIINNNCSNNGYAGIALLYKCINNTISRNVANNNEDSGIYFYEENNNNTVIGNTINLNGGTGISLHWYTNNTIIKENIVNYNKYYGIELYDFCGFNLISENIINNNGERGINIEYQSNINNISNNKIENNGLFGIYLESGCNGNTFKYNTLRNNTEGVHLDSYCISNSILGNEISENTLYGINLIGGGEGDENALNLINDNLIYKNNFGVYLDSSSANNSLSKNFFMDNVKHAYDDGTGNVWNSTTIGNYWDNWTTPDSEPDGIVDDPYTYIKGSANSIDYLPIADETAPVIIINSPSNNDLFGIGAPIYDVTITDSYLYEMWYTLDGGLHNYTFAGSTGTIDQSAWDDAPDGIITLTFYALDKPGNIGSTVVSIEKDTLGPTIVINYPSAGDEFGASAPSFIITITDDHLDSIWYSLDGGLTNYIIAGNATIDQAAWAALSEGSITIAFYANDTVGNLSFEELTITKAIPSGGLDPTIITVIIVVTIVGGVAVIAVIYIFMKKRTTK